jgi:hypothetical protein
VRRLSALAGLAAGLGATTLLARRRRGARRERIDLYHSDGSMVSLDGDSLAGERLLALARRALTAARP